MNRDAREIVDAYVARLRTELGALTDQERGEVADEVRSLLLDASGDDPATAEAQVERFGDPAAFAARILEERGLTGQDGVPSGAWLRLGVAAVIDILTGLAAPFAAVFLVYFILTGAPAGIGVAWAASVVAASVAWVWWVWRPWRIGDTPTTGMALLGVAVLRTPGMRRVVLAGEETAARLALRRRSVLSLVLIPLAAVLLFAAGVAGWVAAAQGLIGR